MKIYRAVLFAIFISSTALAQQTPDMFAPVPSGEGLQGFLDIGFLFHALFSLMLAATLGAAIAYHPRHLQAGASLESVEETQIYILYAVIGSVTGILVVHYGMAVGFVLFGIGGLMRFRTLVRTAIQTGRLIFVTLVGLSAGLNLPHVAIVITLFGFLLIFLLEARFTFRIQVRGLSNETFLAAVASYREVLEHADCQIISEKKYPSRGRIIFIIRCASAETRKRCEESFKSDVDDLFGGSIDWEVI